MTDKIGIRILKPQSIKDVANRLGTARGDLLARVEKAVGDTTIFALSASAAIGDISVEEAIQGIIDFFSDEMRK